jgi:hypothetical protein
MWSIAMSSANSRGPATPRVATSLAAASMIRVRVAAPRGVGISGFRESRYVATVNALAIGLDSPVPIFNSQ